MEEDMTKFENEYPWPEAEEFAAAQDRLLVFLIRGDFARGQRRFLVDTTTIGTFASGQRGVAPLKTTTRLHA
jgi:hypothetical protein